MMKKFRSRNFLKTIQTIRGKHVLCCCRDVAQHVMFSQGHSTSISNTPYHPPHPCQHKCVSESQDDILPTVNINENRLGKLFFVVFVIGFRVAMILSIVFVEELESPINLPYSLRYSYDVNVLKEG